MSGGEGFFEQWMVQDHMWGRRIWFPFNNNGIFFGSGEWNLKTILIIVIGLVEITVRELVVSTILFNVTELVTFSAEFLSLW